MKRLLAALLSAGACFLPLTSLSQAPEVIKGAAKGLENQFPTPVVLVQSSAPATIQWSVEVPKAGVTLGTTLIGSFIGALFAFFLQNLREQRGEQKKRVAAVNRAIHVLSQLWMVQNAYRKDVIEPIRNSSDAWLRLALSTEAHFPKLEVELEDLGFVLGTAHADLYSELLHAQKRYDLAIGLINMRSKTMLEELSPRMEELGYKLGDTLEDLERRAGPTLIGKIKMLTDGIIDEIDGNLKYSWDLYERFRAAMTAELKGAKLVVLSTEKRGS